MNIPFQLDLLDTAPREAGFLEAVCAGLSEPQKQIPCKFFYDRAGSGLFEEICGLDEYYLTRTEIGLLTAHRAEIAGLIGAHADLVEFGCGSLVKVRILLGAMDRPSAFTPIDISRVHLLESAAELAAEYPDLEILPVCADYTKAVKLPRPRGGNAARKVGFFPGSSIGNFAPAAARDFLAVIAEMVGPGGDLVIGVDLKKDEAILNAAYDDAAGVTARFNLNLLRRVNRELGADFDLQRFRHRAHYNEAEGRVEMHLESLADQEVRLDGRVFAFAQGETIHTENSYKYSLTEFTALAEEAGFAATQAWTDDGNLFSIHYLRAL